jgi:adenylate cyclase
MTEQKRTLFIPISVKMITMISLIVIVSFSVMTFLASQMFMNDNRIRIEENTIEKADLIALKAEADFRSILEKSRLAILAAPETGGDARTAKAMLSSVNEEPGDAELFSTLLFQKDPDMIYIGVLKNGKTGYQADRKLLNQAAVQTMPEGENTFTATFTAETPALARAAKGETLVVNVSAYFKRPVIAIMAPYDRTASSVIVTIFSMNLLLEAVKSPNITKSFIVNGRGDVVAHYDQNMVETRANVASLPIVDRMLKSKVVNEKIPYKDSKGDRWIGAFKKMTFSDIGVISTVREETAFRAVRKIRYRTILIGVIALNVAILLIYFFARTISGPVKKLVQLSRRISEGDFAIEIRDRRRDEIGILSRSFADMARGLSEREKMKDAFGRFVNKEIADMVLKGELKLGGERKHAAVFFSDIRSFTAISEQLEPEEVVEFLNDYMTRMVSCVNQTHGVVDKFIGDAIMAVWGTPVSRGNDTENAIECALLMRAALLEFNKDRGGAKKPKINIGCGINTGPLVAGQIGSQERMEYTVIGDTVNLASRIESLNKPFGTDILVSTDAYALVKDLYILEPMEKIKVKGKKAPQQIYAVVNRKNAPGPKTIAEVRKLLGIDFKGIKHFDGDMKESKYELYV